MPDDESTALEGFLFFLGLPGPPRAWSLQSSWTSSELQLCFSYLENLRYVALLGFCMEVRFQIEAVRVGALSGGVVAISVCRLIGITNRYATPAKGVHTRSVDAPPFCLCKRTPLARAPARSGGQMQMCPLFGGQHAYKRPKTIRSASPVAAAF